MGSRTWFRYFDRRSSPIKSSIEARAPTFGFLVHARRTLPAYRVGGALLLLTAVTASDGGRNSRKDGHPALFSQLSAASLASAKREIDLLTSQPTGLDLARLLFHTGRQHAGAACLLYRAAIDYAAEEGIEDTVSEAFNGPNSLSIQYLLGLGLELILKSAIVAHDPATSSEFLQFKVRHDIVRALDEAEKRGFVTAAPHLRDILDLMHDPYAGHWFRYQRPDQFKLPGDFDQVVETLKVLDAEMEATLNPGGPAAA